MTPRYLTRSKNPARLNQRIKFVSAFGGVLFAIIFLVAAGRAAYDTNFALKSTTTNAKVESFQATPMSDCDKYGCKTAWKLSYDVSYAVNGIDEYATVTNNDTDRGKAQPTQPATLKIRYKNSEPWVTQRFVPLWKDYAASAAMFFIAVLFSGRSFRAHKRQGVLVVPNNVYGPTLAAS